MAAQWAVLTIRKHCWEKLWLMYVASMARLRGELKEFPSSWGGSLAVSLTVRRSANRMTQSARVDTWTGESPSWPAVSWEGPGPPVLPEAQAFLTEVRVVPLVKEELGADPLDHDVPRVHGTGAAHQGGQDGVGGKHIPLCFGQLGTQGQSRVRC